jgi:dihydroflavonol-4-reductase
MLHADLRKFATVGALPRMSKHALITGASGFVGGWLAEFLIRSGYKVSALVRKPAASPHLAKLDLRVIQGGLNDPDLLAKSIENVDAVYHVAGLVRALRASELYDVNETGVRNLLTACATRTTPPSVVMVSSLAAAGPSRNDAWKVESDEPSPVSQYGKSKLAGERAARTFAEAMRISIVRPPIVFGGRDTAFAEMIRPIVSVGLHPYPGALPLRRYSVVHVNDLCRALWLVSERGEPICSAENHESRGTGIYFASDAPRFGYIELGRMIAQAAGNRFWTPTPLFDTICWIGGAVNEIVGRLRGKPTLVNLDKVRESSAGSWTCSSEKMVRQLAWSPQKTTAERMQETVDWYFAEGWFRPPIGYRRVHSYADSIRSPQLGASRQAS